MPPPLTPLRARLRAIRMLQPLAQRDYALALVVGERLAE
jgi:hypothetical protein